MADRWLKDRDKQIARCIPDLFDYKTLLYIGIKLRWNYPTFRCQDGFDKAGYQIDVLELSKKNFAELKVANDHGHKFLNVNKGPGMFREIVEGDVRNCDELINGNYDIVMWWQGPEHVYPDEIEPTLEKLWNKTKIMMVLGCPCSSKTGIHSMVKGGKFKGSTSAHFSTIHYSFFENLGFETDLVGECDVKGNNLLAWKRK